MSANAFLWLILAGTLLFPAVPSMAASSADQGESGAESINTRSIAAIRRSQYMSIVNLDGPENQSRETTLKRVALFEALANEVEDGTFKMECLFQIIQGKQSLKPHDNHVASWAGLAEYGFCIAKSSRDDMRFEPLMSVTAINLLQQSIKFNDTDNACLAAIILGEMAKGNTLEIGFLILSEQHAQGKGAGSVIPEALNALVEACDYEIPRSARAGAALLALRLAEKGSCDLAFADRLYDIWLSEPPVRNEEVLSRAQFANRRLRLAGEVPNSQ